MADTEDPIATLREAHRRIDDNGACWWLDAEAIGAAIDALASTLAERTNELAAYQRTWGPLLIGAEPVKCLGCYNRTERITELEATLAERDRRIAELEEQLTTAKAGWLSALKFADAPAPAPGELAGLEYSSAIQTVADIAKNLAPGDSLAEAIEVTCLAARSWQRLQWRPASEAPVMRRCLFRTSEHGIVSTHIGHRYSDGWADETREAETYPGDVVTGWLPLDALPALNGGDDNG